MKVLRIFAREFAAVLVLLCFFCAAAQRAQAQSFTYSDFSNPAGLQINGSASAPVLTNSVNVLQLTPTNYNLDGSAWYTTTPGTPNNGPLPLVSGFTTTFTIEFTNRQDLGGADGIVFLIQNGSINGTSGALAVAAQAPNSPPGGLLGYFGLTNSVAIQFDTFYNYEYADVASSYGPGHSSADQISVQSCGPNGNTSDHNALGGPNGVSCTFGTVDLSTLVSPLSPIDMADGNPHIVQITYVAPPTASAGSCTPGSTPNSGPCGSLAIMMDGHTVLTVPFSLSYLGLDANDDAFPGFTASTGGGDQTQDILSWNFGVTVVQNFSTDGTTTSNFTTTGGENQLSIDTSGTGGNVSCYDKDGGLSTCGSVTLATTNTLISNTDPAGIASWFQYVNGTPWGPSICAARPANGGQNLCSLFVNQCYGGSTNVPQSQASDYYCPQVAAGSPTDVTINLADTYDQSLDNKLGVTPGTTVSLLDYTPPNPAQTWTPTPVPITTSAPNPVCTNVSGTGSGSAISPTQCNVFDSLLDVFGDQTTQRGTTPKHKGWIISIFNVPMLLTNVNVVAAAGCPSPTSPLNDTILADPNFESPTYAQNIWNNGACLLDFVVNPAQPPMSSPYNMGTSLNYFQPAPPAAFFWGSGAPAVCSPGPSPCVVPPSGDTVYYNPTPSCGVNYLPPSPCAPNAWDLQVANSISIPLSSLGGDGTHTIHWSASDVVGISEKNIQLISAGTCYDPEGLGGINPPCYNTSYFTTIVNIDSTAPSITVSFSSTAPPVVTPVVAPFTVDQTVYPVYTCVDSAPGSGIANCAGTAVGPPAPGGACPLTPPTVNSPTPLNTSSPGSFSYPQVSATDCAGNMSTLSGQFTVNQAPLTITASSTTIPYGTAIPTITPSYIGFVGTDTPASLTTPPTCSVTGVPAGNPVGTYTTTCSGAVDANYTISYVTGTLKITAVSLTITASSTNVGYGAPIPAVTASYNGFVGTDSPASLSTQPTCSTTATSTSNVGSYPTSCSGAVDANYSIGYVGGLVKVGTVNVTIAASSGAMTYGGAVPAITPNYSGVMNGHYPSTPPTCSTTAKSSSPVGNYPSSCMGAADADYTFNYVTGSVTVNQAPLTITASSANVLYGAAIPAITASYSGFVNGDSSASLSTQPTCSTTAKSTSPGVYPSTCTGAVDPNYSISYVKGTVTVGAQPTLGISPTSLNFGTIKIGTTYSLTLTLTNNGNAPIKLSSVSVSGPDSDEFSAANHCSSSLGAGAKCTITVTYHADRDDTNGTSGKLVITDNAVGSPQAVPLSGKSH